MNGFSLADIFKMAQKAESNAAVFYRKAAMVQVNLHDSDTLKEMAVMEENHRAFFAEMEQKLAGGAASGMQDPYGDVQMYLHGLIERHGGEGSRHMDAELTGKETFEDVLRMALNSEAQSILFYIGLKDAFTVESDRKHIDKIIEEEKKHLTTLQRLLESAIRTL